MLLRTESAMTMEIGRLDDDDTEIYANRWRTILTDHRYIRCTNIAVVVECHESYAATNRVHNDDGHRTIRRR